MKAVQEGAQSWLDRCESDQDLMLRPIIASQDKSMSAQILADNFPARFFPSANEINVLDDKLMVAEACIYGKQLLISEDSESINQGTLNKWLYEQGYTPHGRLLMTRREALLEIECLLDPTLESNPIYLWGIASAIPEENTGEDLVHLKHTARSYADAQMSYIKVRFEQGRLDDLNPIETCAKIREMFPRISRQTSNSR